MSDHELMVRAVEGGGGTVCGATHRDPVSGETCICYLGPHHERGTRQPDHECSCQKRWPATPAGR